MAFSRRCHDKIRKKRYMHKMRCVLINRRSLLLAFRLLWKTQMYPSFFFSSRRRHTRYIGDWSSDVCSSDLRDLAHEVAQQRGAVRRMHDLEVELGGVEPALLVRDHGDGRIGRGADHPEARGQAEIGRASCRERV